MSEPQADIKKPLLLDGMVHITAAAAGFIVATAVAAASGVPVAWATFMYYWLGWPLMCTVIWLIARAYPERPWRWPLSMMVGQVFSSILYGNATFVIQAVVFVTLLSAPQFFAAVHGAKSSRKRHVAHEEKNPNKQAASEKPPQE